MLFDTHVAHKKNTPGRKLVLHLTGRTIESGRPFLWMAATGNTLAPVQVGDAEPCEQVIPLYNCGDVPAHYTLDSSYFQQVAVSLDIHQCCPCMHRGGREWDVSVGIAERRKGRKQATLLSRLYCLQSWQL